MQRTERPGTRQRVSRRAPSESGSGPLPMRSHIVALQKGRPAVEPEPRSSRGDRGFALLASCRRDARRDRSRSRSPCARWRVDARERRRRARSAGGGGRDAELTPASYEGRQPHLAGRRRARSSTEASASRATSWAGRESPRARLVARCRPTSLALAPRQQSRATTTTRAVCTASLPQPATSSSRPPPR